MVVSPAGGRVAATEVWPPQPAAHRVSDTRDRVRRKGGGRAQSAVQEMTQSLRGTGTRRGPFSAGWPPILRRLMATTVAPNVRRLAQYRPFERGGLDLRAVLEDLVLVVATINDGTVESVLGCREDFLDLWGIE